MSESITLKLNLKERQLSSLRSLFKGIDDIAPIVTSYNGRLDTAESISLFMLLNKSKLYSAIGHKDWSEKSSELKEIISNISSGKDNPSIVMPPNSSITKEHKIYIPIGEIREVEVTNGDSLYAWKKRINNQEPKANFSFSITRKSNNFDITILPCEHSEGIKVLSLKQIFKKYTKSIKLLGKYTATDYTQLSGHAVSGGLPSLGKRR